jgi:hypothetical protein
MDTLVLQYNVSLGNRVQLSSAELRKDDGECELWPIDPKGYSYDGLIELSHKMVNTLGAVVSIAGSSGSVAVRGYLESLQAQGRQLREALLPDEVIERLETRPSIQHIIFRCDPLLNGVPYGCIFLWNDFLYFSHAIGKQLLSQHCPPSLPAQATDSYQGFSILDPDRQLMAEMGANDSKKFQDIWDMFRERWDDAFTQKISFQERTFRSVNKETVEEVLQMNHFVNFIIHHIYSDEDPSQSGYILRLDRNGEPAVVFTANDLYNSLSTGDQRPRIILSVSCESGITRGWEADWPQDDHLHGIVDSMLRLGIPHYIGTLVKVPVIDSLQIVLPFYKAIALGHTVGESLRQARFAFRKNRSDTLDAGTILGLAFILYGDPSKAYFCAEGHCTNSIATVGCTDVSPENSICNRTVCPEEAGFGQKRCELHWAQKQISCSAGHIVDSLADVKFCSVDGCSNTFCQDCTGSANSLCWFHSCHNGHEIKGIVRKTCLDTQEIHPKEKRTVCPLDDGWIRSLCDLCLSALEGAAQEQQVCPHDGKFITKDNPWSGICVDPGCGKQICSECRSWHEATMYCRDPQRDRNAKDAGWLNYLEKKGQKEHQLASRSHLREISSAAEKFQATILTNVKERKKRFDLMPRLSLPIWEIIGPQGRILGVEDTKADLGDKFFGILKTEWKLPIDLTTDNQWYPPEDWLIELRQVNQLKIHVVKSTWGSPIIVGVSTLAPVKFKSNCGPVIAPGDAGHIRNIEQTIKNWWKKDNSRKMPDIYLVVLGVGGWVRNLEPISRPGFLSVLAEPAGGSWAVLIPEMEGRQEYVRSFVELLKPETFYMRLNIIRRWIEKHLKTWDSVSLFRVQEEVEKQSTKTITDHEVLDVFKILSEKDNYTLCKLNDKPAIRCATQAERSRRLLQRRWVELSAVVVGVIASVAIWQLRPWILRSPTNHWTSWLIATLFCVLLCQIFGQFLKKISKYLR